MKKHIPLYLFLSVSVTGVAMEQPVDKAKEVTIKAPTIVAELAFTPEQARKKIEEISQEKTELSDLDKASIALLEINARGQKASCKQQ